MRELASWAAEDIHRALKLVAATLGGPAELGRLADQAKPETKRRIAEDHARYGGEQAKLFYLRGAAGLHTAVAAASWREAEDAPVLEHVGLIGTYFQDLLVRLDPAYAAVWCRVGGTLLAASVHFGAALQHYDRCLAWRPHDPWLLLGRGSTLESASIAISGLPRDGTLPDWEGPQDAPGQIEKAAGDYEAALEQDADLAEARIRLARLRLHTGNLQAAARHLSLAQQNALPPVPGYWAHLLLGPAQERTGQWNDAAAQYRMALALFPDAQAAAVALGHLLAERMEARAEGLVVVREQITPSGYRTFSSDPWWLYPGGQAWRAQEWLDDFERRSRQ
ncbi:MAG: hypothetical protein HYX76_03335 [Acidobacteria bacterium]|nr:hypothetical protein [Acidobacteriota bacterium]